MPLTSAFGSSVRECSLSVHEYHWSIVGRTGRHTSFGRGGRRFKSCHSDQHLASPETSIPTVSPSDTRRSGYCRRQLLANAAMADLARRLVAVRRRAILMVSKRRCPQPWLAYRRGSTLHDTEADLVIPCLDSQSGEAAPTTLFSTDGLPGFFPDRFSRRSTSSPTAGAGVSRRRLDKQQANHLFPLTESPQSAILQALSKQRTPRWP